MGVPTTTKAERKDNNLAEIFFRSIYSWISKVKIFLRECTSGLTVIAKGRSK